jgi:integrase
MLMSEWAAVASAALAAVGLFFAARQLLLLNRQAEHDRRVAHEGVAVSWRPIEAGLPERLRFHDLRHSYATWLVSDGLPPNIVQRIMGHEDVTTTLGIYTDVPEDYVDRVDTVFDDSVMTDEDEEGAS